MSFTHKNYSKSKFLTLTFVALLLPMPQARGIGTATKITSAVAATGLMLWRATALVREQILRKKDKQECASTLAPALVQEAARKIYNEICHRNRRWWDLRGKIHDLLMKRLGYLDVYIAVDNKEMDEKRFAMGAGRLGIVVNMKKGTQTINLTEKKRQITHELFHVFRGDTLRKGHLGEKTPYPTFFANLLEAWFPILVKIKEFRTERATFTFLAQTGQWDAFNLGSDEYFYRLQYPYPLYGTEYVLGALNGIWTGLHATGLIKQTPQNEKGHDPACQCRACSFYKILLAWKPKGYLHSLWWFKAFLSKRFPEPILLPAKEGTEDSSEEEQPNE